MYAEGAIIDGRFRILSVRPSTVGYICEVWLWLPLSSLSRRVLVRKVVRQKPSHCEVPFARDYCFFQPTRHLRETETSSRPVKKSDTRACFCFQELRNNVHHDIEQRIEFFEIVVGTEKIFHIVIVSRLASRSFL